MMHAALQQKQALHKQAQRVANALVLCSFIKSPTTGAMLQLYRDS